MKANEFKEVIRRLVIEEVQREVTRQLPKLLFEMLGQQPKTVVREASTVQSPQPRRVQTESIQQPQMVNNSPKPIKRYAKDPMLNAILNETTPGLPQTPYGQTGVPLPDFQQIGVSEEFMGEMKELMNENVSPVSVPIQQMETESVEEPSQDLSRLFNKNFKAILNKSKERGANSGNFPGLIQNW